MLLQVIKLQQQLAHLDPIHGAIIVSDDIAKVSIPLHATHAGSWWYWAYKCRMGVHLCRDEWRIILANSPLMQSSEKIEFLYFTWWHQRIPLLTE